MFNKKKYICIFGSIFSAIFINLLCIVYLLYLLVSRPDMGDSYIRNTYVYKPRMS